MADKHRLQELRAAQFRAKHGLSKDDVRVSPVKGSERELTVRPKQNLFTNRGNGARSKLGLVVRATGDGPKVRTSFHGNEKTQEE